MILAFPRSRAVAVLALVTLTALPLAAATTTSKKHLIRPVPEVTVTGVVRDASNNKPVKNVVVSNGILSSTTDDSGAWTLKLPQGRTTLLTATWFAFRTQTISITPGAGSTLNFSLTPNPIITVKTMTGESFD